MDHESEINIYTYYTIILHLTILSFQLIVKRFCSDVMASSLVSDVRMSVVYFKLLFLIVHHADLSF